MSSGDKKAAGSGSPGGQSKSKSSKPTNAMNPATQPEFIVEKIVGKRYWNGRPQVLIKWQGYSPEENTWEPMENVGNCMVLLADFEAELFKSKERKKRLKKALAKNKTSSSGSRKSDEQLPAATESTSHASAHSERRVESGKSMGPKANLTNSAPKPNASHKMDKAELSHNALVKRSKKQDPGSSSFYKLALSRPSSDDDEDDDTESLSSGSSSESSESDSEPLSKLAASKAAKEMVSRNHQDKASYDGASIKTKEMQNKAVSKKMRRHSNSATTEDSIDKVLKSIHSNPMVTPISPLASSPEITKRTVEKSQINQTPKRPKRSPKKSETKESDDDSEGTGWKVPLRKAPFGLDRGLELDKIVHNFKVLDKLFLCVTWKGVQAFDLVRLEELKLAYPAQVMQYFESMKRITEDPSP